MIPYELLQLAKVSWLHHLSVSPDYTIAAFVKSNFSPDSKQLLNTVVIIDLETLEIFSDGENLTSFTYKWIEPHQICSLEDKVIFSKENDYDIYETLDDFYHRKGIEPLSTPNEISFEVPDNYLILEHIAVLDGYLFLSIIDGIREELCFYQQENHTITVLTAFSPYTTKTGETAQFDTYSTKIYPNCCLRYPLHFQKGNSYPLVIFLPDMSFESACPPFLEATRILNELDFFTITFSLTGKPDTDIERLLTLLTMLQKVEPAIDIKKIALSGIHYGAYIVHMLLGIKNGFYAAVSFDGLTNLTSACGISSGLRFDESNIYDTLLYRNTESLWNASPIKYAQGMNTPTLLFTNPQDHRTSMQEAQQMYQLLIEQNIPVKMIPFHESTRYFCSPSNWIIYLAETLSWLRTNFPSVKFSKQI